MSNSGKMLDGIYNNASNVNMLEQWQQTISRNLASSQAAGFKRSQFSVSSESGSKETGDLNRSGNTSSSPKSNNRVDLTTGAIQQTGKKTDLAIDGPGFFQIQGTDGSTSYTRNGEFEFNKENNLVTKTGQLLMGEGGPIIIDPEKGALTISEDGTMSQGDNVLGKLPLHNFAKGEADLEQISGGFLAKKGVSSIPVEKPMIIQGAIEGSNVSPITEMISLVMVSNAYQSSQKLISSHDTLMGQAIQTLGAPPTQ